MLKLFRKYGKWILVVGACILMVAFLLPSVNMFSDDPRDAVIGRVHGQKVRAHDQITANRELELLKHLGAASGLQLTQGETPLAWFLMQNEAERLGIGASQQEVNTLLVKLDLSDPQLMQTLLKAQGVEEGFLRQALAHWITVWRYRELVTGVQHVTAAERLDLLRLYTQELQSLQDLEQRLAFLGQGNPFVQSMRQRAYAQILGLQQRVQGTARLSDEMLRHLSAELRSQVEINAVPVHAVRYLSEVPDPDAATVQALYDAHKDAMPGRDAPDGLGYKRPDRVKIEWLELPVDRLSGTVQVDEIEANAYYQKNLDRYTVTEPVVPPGTQPGTQPSTQPDSQPATIQRTQRYAEVRDDIMQSLRTEKAQELSLRLMRAIRARISAKEDQLRMSEAYREIPADWQAPSLIETARAVAGDDQFGGMVPSYRRESDWLTPSQVAALPGLGNSVVPAPTQQGYAPLDAYIQSARQFKPTLQNPLLTLRLQESAVSQIVYGQQGDKLYLFRLFQISPSQPAPLDEIRPQVAADARMLAAYAKLIEPANLESLQAQLQDKTLEELAAVYNPLGSVVKPSPFPRRTFSERGLVVPDIQGIGRSQGFVDQVFERVDKLAADGSLSDNPESQRRMVIAVPESLSVQLVRLVDYKPVSRQIAEMDLTDPTLPNAIAGLMSIGAKSSHPLSESSIVSRTGFTYANGQGPRNRDAESEETDPTGLPGM